MELKTYRPAPDLLRGRVVLVTGASRGIGRVAALTFARHGATVVLLGRDVVALERTYDEIEAAGMPQPSILPLDLARARAQDFDLLARAIEGQLRRLDGVLHNASHLLPPAALEHQSLDDWVAAWRVNVAAPFALTQACLHLLKASPDAPVVLTAETHAIAPGAFWGGFAVSKSALLALNTIQAQEWERFSNLRSNVIVPGPVDAPLRAQTHPGEARASRRQPAELMSLYLYLIGPDSRGVSGKVFDAATVLNLSQGDVP